MVGARPLNFGNLFDRPLSEPGELIKGYEQFLVGEQKPKTMLRNMGHFSRQSGGSRHLGSPSSVRSQLRACQNFCVWGNPGTSSFEVYASIEGERWTLFPSTNVILDWMCTRRKSRIPWQSSQLQPHTAMPDNWRYNCAPFALRGRSASQPIPPARIPN